MKGTQQAIGSTAFKPSPTAVSFSYDELGDPDGVKLTVNGKKLWIDLIDSYRGNNVTWKEASKMKLPTEQQAYLVLAFIQDINAKLQEAGGDPIDGSYFTSQYKDGVVQIYGYQDRGGYSYIVPSDSKVINSNYKVRQIKEL